MGQAFSRVGTPDPRKGPDGKLEPRLASLFRSFKKEDAPPSRVRPVPVTLVTWLLSTAYTSPSPSPSSCALADMICLAFFFLLRPGEYTGTTNDDAAFSMADVRLFLGSRRLNLAQAPIPQLQAAPSVSLHFTTQKNQVKGESVSLGATGHHLCCPVRAAIRRVVAHRRHFDAAGASLPQDTIFATYYYDNQPLRVRAAHVTNDLRRAAAACQASTGIPPPDISARSLRAGGAMALMCADQPKDTIKLVGRWQSDPVIRYLHQDAQPIVKNLASKMFRHGTYNFLPTAEVELSHDA